MLSHESCVKIVCVHRVVLCWQFRRIKSCILIKSSGLCVEPVFQVRKFCHRETIVIMTFLWLSPQTGAIGTACLTMSPVKVGLFNLQNPIQFRLKTPFKRGTHGSSKIPFTISPEVAWHGLLARRQAMFHNYFIKTPGSLWMLKFAH